MEQYNPGKGRPRSEIRSAIKDWIHLRTTELIIGWSPDEFSYSDPNKLQSEMVLVLEELASEIKRDFIKENK